MYENIVPTIIINTHATNIRIPIAMLSFQFTKSRYTLPFDFNHFSKIYKRPNPQCMIAKLFTVIEWSVYNNIFKGIFEFSNPNDFILLPFVMFVCSWANIHTHILRMSQDGPFYSKPQVLNYTILQRIPPRNYQKQKCCDWYKKNASNCFIKPVSFLPPRPCKQHQKRQR